MTLSDDELALMRLALVEVISVARPQDLQVAVPLKRKIIAEIDSRRADAVSTIDQKNPK